MILVIGEQRDGKLNRATWEAVAGAQKLAASTPITVVVPGGPGGNGASAAANEIAAAQVKEVVVLEHDALTAYTPDGFTAALQGVISQLSPAYVLLPHTYQTRDFAPKLAARLDRAIITDVTGIKTGSGQGAVFTRPMFQGKLTADVVPQGPGPHFVTFQIGAFRIDQAARGAAPASVRSMPASVDASAIRQKPEAPFQQAKQAVDLSQAERIVSVGRGIKEQANIGIAEQLAKALGAEIAASRPICDSGWLPMERQVGSSGQTVAPKLYLALGISGAIQHLVGMKGSHTVVAINKDPDAPIFEIADYGIVGDLFEIVPAMIEALKA
ncbi:MAG TPA: electron transfer flavoprotein subunit alpha/FixB family protein [Vicinamibacterales bacterium]|nr:electron transfer flavoprotein subunit alpha/FixB family protein [Vicinamibacterales bacterium]